MSENCALFVVTLLHSATNTHLFHWNTDSYSKHIALGEYYDGIVELTDSFAEAYMGKYGKFTTFPSVYHQPKDPIRYLESLQSFVADARQDLPQDSELQNLIDEIADLINTTTYKLKFLK
jgi:DNA-binding ferritin-like protein